MLLSNYFNKKDLIIIVVPTTTLHISFS